MEEAMTARLADIIKTISVFELGASELDQPISVTDKGDVATIRQLIAERAPDGVRAMFGAAASPAGAHVLPVDKLDRQSLRRVAIEVLRKSDSHERVAVGLLGDYTPQRLIEEVERGTIVGRQITDAVRLNGALIERAVKNGKIRPKADLSTDLHIPDFYF
jgi:hypothetical protein